MSNFNPPDMRGIHKYRFNWKSMVTAPPKKIKNIILKMENYIPKYYYEIALEDNVSSSLKEIINANLLSTIKKESKNFKVIGAKGRRIIMGEIKFEEIDDNRPLLILADLNDWRSFSRNT